MMNCEEARLQIGADPAASAPPLEAHLADTPVEELAQLRPHEEDRRSSQEEKEGERHQYAREGSLRSHSQTAWLTLENRKAEARTAGT